MFDKMMKAAGTYKKPEPERRRRPHPARRAAWWIPNELMDIASSRVLRLAGQTTRHPGAGKTHRQGRLRAADLPGPAGHLPQRNLKTDYRQVAKSSTASSTAACRFAAFKEEGAA